jgi:dual specificity tyrosine-phosphorylation-regulated kinase 2/3/4
LTNFEQKEILAFSEIFFWGGNPNKIKTNTLLPNEGKKRFLVFFKLSLFPPKGFDDDKGDYKIIFKDHVAYRYEIISSLGKGAFGHVVKVLDHKTKKYLALKIIKNRTRYYQQAQVELKILHYIKSKSFNCKMVEVVDNFNFRNHFCMTFPLLGINLYDLLKANQFRGFDLHTIRMYIPDFFILFLFMIFFFFFFRFAFQLLKALKFLAKNKIMHCDLKVLFVVD